MSFNYFNFRIGTELYTYKIGDEIRTQRIFSIVEIHYKNGIPVTYGAKREDLNDYVNKLSFADSVDELKGTFKLIKKAFKKPVIDLDNFPNKYKEKHK